MDLTLSDDQRELQLGLCGLLADLWSDDALRAAADGEDAGKRWLQLAEVGIFGVCASERSGGMGLGIADAAVLFEELGAALVPGPLVTTTLAAALLSESVPGAVSGQAAVTFLDLRDEVRLVEHLATSTHVLILEGDGMRLATADQVPGERVDRPLDPLTPMWSVAPDVDLATVGEKVGDADAAADLVRRAAVLTAALQVGVARGALDRAVRYASERSQFGRVIGSFQAVKHLLAEALVRVEVARAAVIVAALCVDDPEAGEREEEVAAAQLLAEEAAVLNGRCGIQVHGGMGFTWEVLAHLYLKRAWLLETAYGSGDAYAARLAESF